MGIDWQFVVVTIVALGAAGVLVRRLMPAPRRSATGATVVAPGCAHCPSSAEQAATRPQSRTTTTPVVLLRDLRR